MQGVPYPRSLQKVQNDHKGPLFSTAIQISTKILALTCLHSNHLANTSLYSFCINFLPTTKQVCDDLSQNRRQEHEVC